MRNYHYHNKQRSRSRETNDMNKGHNNSRNYGSSERHNQIKKEYSNKRRKSRSRTRSRNEKHKYRHENVKYSSFEWSKNSDWDQKVYKPSNNRSNSDYITKKEKEKMSFEKKKDTNYYYEHNSDYDQEREFFPFTDHYNPITETKLEKERNDSIMNRNYDTIIEPSIDFIPLQTLTSTHDNNINLEKSALKNEIRIDTERYNPPQLQETNSNTKKRVVVVAETKPSDIDKITMNNVQQLYLTDMNLIKSEPIQSNLNMINHPEVENNGDNDDKNNQGLMDKSNNREDNDHEILQRSEQALKIWQTNLKSIIEMPSNLAIGDSDQEKPQLQNPETAIKLNKNDSSLDLSKKIRQVSDPTQHTIEWNKPSNQINRFSNEFHSIQISRNSKVITIPSRAITEEKQSTQENLILHSEENKNQAIKQVISIGKVIGLEAKKRSDKELREILQAVASKERKVQHDIEQDVSIRKRIIRKCEK